MVMRPEPLFDTVEPLRGEETHVVLMSPRGRTLSHAVAHELAQEREHLVLICGRYEGVDQRVVWGRMMKKVGKGPASVNAAGPGPCPAPLAPADLPCALVQNVSSLGPFQLPG